MPSLPYVTSPGNVDRALRAIKTAATPPKVSQDFVKTILQIRGGSGDQMTSYLKKIGFVNADGSPSDLYKSFRNPDSSGRAIAQALRIGYVALYKRNEYMHQLPDDKLRGLVIEETGQGDDSKVVSCIIGCIKGLKKHADWSTSESEEAKQSELAIAKSSPESTNYSAPQTEPQHSRATIGLNLGYTINLNLPATSDPAVFNAIFKSLKENLLRNDHE